MCLWLPDTFPKIQTAVLTLISKAGKPSNNPENFRPISLLEIPEKIFQRILSIRLRSYLEDNQLLHIRQYGFRQSRGTSIAIAIALADNKKVSIVLRDAAKAFDKVWHPGNKYRLLHLNLPRPSIKTLQLPTAQESQNKGRPTSWSRIPTSEWSSTGVCALTPPPSKSIAPT